MPVGVQMTSQQAIIKSPSRGCTCAHQGRCVSDMLHDLVKLTFLLLCQHDLSVRLCLWVCAVVITDYNFYLFCLLYVLIYLSSPVKSFHLVQSTVCNFLSKLTFTYLTVAFTWYILKIGCDYSSLMVEYRSFSEYFAHRR